jgi:hypothetical protein
MIDDLESLDVLGTPLIEGHDLLQMLVRFAFNTVVIWLMIHCLYYRKSKRRDYYFTFMLISISIFFLIYLLGGVKIKVGFALGLFAIFGIIRYRTESMPVREMTYLFCIIAISVINALAVSISYAELIAVNAMFLLSTWFFESYILLKHVSSKLVQYDRIALIKPDKRAELIEDLKQRTGLNVTKVDVGGIDFLRDMAMLKVYYVSDQTSANTNTIEDKLKLSHEDWTEVKS